jgi:two-component system response regulator
MGDRSVHHLNGAGYLRGRAPAQLRRPSVSVCRPTTHPQDRSSSVATFTQIDILLVEDNPEDAEVTMRALRKHGLANNLQWVKDGSKAFVALFGDDADGDDIFVPRVILLDLRLPKIDGLEVLQRVKRDPRTRSIPVVVMTSSTQEEDIAKSYALGSNSFVSKPVRFEAFVTTVEQLDRYWLVINKVPNANACKTNVG